MKKRLSVMSLAAAAAALLAAPAEGSPCDKQIHIHAADVHICMDRPA